MITNCNTAVWTFHDCFWHIRTRPNVQQASCPLPTTFSSVKPPSLCDADCFHAYEIKTLSPSFTEYTGCGRKTWWFLSYNKMKSIPSFYVNLLLKLSLSQSNVNIHFLNIVSVRWRPLLSAHSRKRRTSDKSLTQSFDDLSSSKLRSSSWMFSFCGRCCFSAVSHPQQQSIATSDTVVPMNIEVPMKYPVSHDDRIVVLEIRLHSESPMLYRPALRGNWNALSLARRVLKEKFPTPTIPLTAVLPNHQVFLPDPVFHTPKKCFYFITNRFLEQNMYFTLKINSDICGSLIGSKQSQTRGLLLYFQMLYCILQSATFLQIDLS